MSNELSIKSPCVRNCCLDTNDVCVGCYRTINEIMDWSSMTSEQKNETLEICTNRQRQDDTKKMHF